MAFGAWTGLTLVLESAAVGIKRAKSHLALAVQTPPGRALG
jgi:hypothetical protein